MDPCPFARLIIESLALKLPASSRSSSGNYGVHPTTTPCYCKISLKNFSSQTALLPLVSLSSPSSSSLSPGGGSGGTGEESPPSSDSTTSAEGFHLNAETLRRLSSSTGRPGIVRLSVYSGRMGRTCGVSTGKLIGSVEVKLDLKGAEAKPIVYQSGWMMLGKKKRKDKDREKLRSDSVSVGGGGRVHVVVRTEPEPRFVFQFGGEPECSPVVFQVRGNSVRQPVFSCKFSADRNSRTRSLPTNFTPDKKGWIRRTLSIEKEKPSRERKGWMVMIHDLSGSPVAAASVITPFVPSPGTDRVSRSNPGAWLILRPHHGSSSSSSSSLSSWKPWGRLEAWRERGGAADGLGYKFELVNDTSTATGIPIAEATLSVKNGGRFWIDKKQGRTHCQQHNHGSHGQHSPVTMAADPRSPVRGFVMGSTVEGEGKMSRPIVQVGAQHVTCMADAALFVALSAAVDLSMDACKLFSHKLRKELCSDAQQHYEL